MAKTIMTQIVQKNYPKTTAKISFSSGYPPLTPTKANYELLAQLSDVSKDLGFGKMTAVNPRKAGAAGLKAQHDTMLKYLDRMGADVDELSKQYVAAITAQDPTAAEIGRHA